MRVWLQSADFSSEDFNLDLEGIVHLYESHDWSSANELEKELTASGKEACEPGLGIVKPGGYILHICPYGESATVHYHRPKRLWGFLWPLNKVETNTAISASDITELIERFACDDYDRVEELML